MTLPRHDIAEDAFSIAVADDAVAHRWAEQLRHRQLFEEVIVTAGRLTVRFDPCLIAPAMIDDALSLVTSPSAQPIARPCTHHVVPVSYGGADHDLDAIASQTGMSREDVITAHLSTQYTVQNIGFIPGFAYLAGLPGCLTLPRRPAPRPRVPAGSVAIAGGLCGIYPVQSPGGWWILGQTNLPLFDPSKDDPFRMHPGDTVEFCPR